MPPRLPRCSAFSLNKSYSVSDSGSETSMSIRIPSALVFTWLHFRWQRKWLNAAEKELSSSAVDSLAMDSFETSCCCVFQVGYCKLHQQNVSNGLAHCADLKSTWRRPWLKRESTALSLMNIALRKLALRPTIDTFARKHPWCLLLEKTASHRTAVCVLMYSTIINTYFVINYFFFCFNCISINFYTPKRKKNKNYLI